MAYNVAGGGNYALNSSIGSTDTSLTLVSFTEPVSGVPYTMTLLNTSIAYATIGPKTSSSEFVSFTGITQNLDGTATITGVVRGLAKKYPFTSSSTFQLPHSGQSVFILSDAPQVFNQFASLANDETFTGLITFTQTPIGINPGGQPDASTTVKGVGRVSVAPVSSTIPIFVGDNDGRVPTQNENDALVGQSGTAPSSSNKFEDDADTATVATANKLVRALGTGLIDPTFYLNSGASTFTANANITAAQPLTIGYQQSDGGVLLDTSGASVTGATQTVTVGVHSNRGLLVFLNTGNSSNANAITSVTYNGVAMTQTDSATYTDVNGRGQQVASYYLSAPATGANTLAVNASTSFAGTGSFYSVYNVSQSGQPEAHTTASKTNGQSTTLATIANGAEIFSWGSINATSGTLTNFTGTGAFANASGVYSSGVVFPAATTITSTATVSGTSVQAFMVSLAPFTVPVMGVYPSSSATSTYSQFQNGYDTFVGFANASVSSGVSVATAIGGLSTNQSGLTSGRQYYLNDSSGTIGTTAGTHSRKVGISTSATSILVTNIW